MKKVALSLIALLAAGSFAFAEDSAAGTTIPTPLTATLSANGWAQFGTDLDTGSLGFKNGTEAKITLDILNGTSTKGDQGGVIAVADIKLRLDGNVGGAPTYGTVGTDDFKKAFDTYNTEFTAAGGDKAKEAAALSKFQTATGVVNSKGALYLTIGDVTAKIVLGDLYIKLTTNTNPIVDYSVDGDNDNGGASIVADDAFYTYSGLYGSGTEWTVGTTMAVTNFDGTGIEVGYTIPKLVSITTAVASAGAWSSTDKDGQDFEGQVVVGLLAVDKLTLNVKGYIGSVGNEKKTAAGVDFAYDLGVAVPFLHLNAGADTTTAMADGFYALDAGAKLPIVDGLKAVAVAKYDSASKVDFTLTSDLAKSKLAGPLGAQFGIQLKNVTSSVDKDSTKTTAIFAKVEADVADGINVWGKTSFDNTGADKSDSLFLKAGVTASKLLPMTELSATWESNDMGGYKEQGDNTKGQFYVQAKVSY